MEPGLASGTSSAAATPPEVTRTKSLSASLSSSDKDLKLDVDEVSQSRTSATSPDEQNKDAQLASNYCEEDFSVNSTPTHEHQLSDGSAIELPPTQVMDRASDSTSPDPDRIPPHVFARTKSSAPVEWSVTSNESLFSIHMGTMSFTREQFNWMNKSGELGYPGDIQFSGPLIDIPGSSPPPPLPPAQVDKSAELGLKSGNMNQGLGATEAAAAETMREVIRENAGNDNDQEKKSVPKVDPRGITPKHSDDSSIKSFAFPILTGDVEKCGSLSMKEKQKKQHSQPQTPKTATATEAEVPEPQSEVETSKPQTPKANKNASQGKWFSCFSCCPFCS